MTAVDHRRNPRRRGESLEVAILTAALVELEAGGWSEFRMDSVASRARVSKASLYRRWPGKSELVTAAVEMLRPDPVALPDTGSLREDLLVVFRLIAAQLSGPAGAALRGLLAETWSAPPASGFRQRSDGRSAQLVDRVIQRADSRGQLHAAAVTPLQRATGPALVRHQFLAQGTVSDAYIVDLVDQVLIPLFQ